MAHYYNENDPYCVQWLRNLIKARHLPEGDVDDRSITDVRPEDLKGYQQHHFFAGIGGWPHALKLARWPEDRPVWTGSCPCQPFSNAGKRRGTDDERHLWPEWYRLINQFQPATIFGEQVASKDGRSWLSSVRSDLEALGYAVGAADLCAAGIGAPHIRQRLWFVAVPESRWRERILRKNASGSTGRCCRRDVAYTNANRCEPTAASGGDNKKCDPQSCGRLDNSFSERLERHSRNESNRDQSGRIVATEIGPTAPTGSSVWDDIVWLPGSDGKARPIKPGIEPLAHGISGRMALVRTRRQFDQEEIEEHFYNRKGALRGFGNAIVPQVAAEFVRSFTDIS